MTDRSDTQQLFICLFAVHAGLLNPMQLISLIIKSEVESNESLVTMLRRDCGLKEGNIMMLKEMSVKHLESCQGDEMLALDRLLLSLTQDECASVGKTTERSAQHDVHTVSFEQPDEKSAYFTQLSPDTGKELPYRPLNDAQQLTSEHKDRYLRKGEFGRGGIGRVILAIDRHLGREVAIKELLPHLRDHSGESREKLDQTTVAAIRFLQEARITGQLEHPGIIPVYELGQREDGTIYYVMKLVRGKTMRSKIAEASDLSERLELLPHFLDLCQTLAYAHSRGVIHRDIKPDNVMIGEFGETVVLDWGLAKVKGIEDTRASQLSQSSQINSSESSSVTVEGTTLGTPAFMPPEQAQGDIENIDERSDVWSLGVVLYQILSGHLPFKGKTALQVMRKVIHEDPVPINKHSPNSPPELIAVAEKCIKRNPSDRYRDAGELALEIQRYLSGGMIRVFSYSPIMLIKRWLKQHKALAFTICISLILLSILGIWSHVMIAKERDQALVAKQYAEQKEQETRTSLSQALAEQGMYATIDSRWSEARIFYAGALTYLERQDAQLWLNMESLQPYHLQQVKNLGNHQGYCVAVGISPDESLALSGGFDGSILVWDLLHEKLERSLIPLEDWISAIEYSNDNKFVGCSSAKGSIRLMSADTFDTIWSREAGSHIRCLCFSPDGKTLLAGEGSGRVFFYNTKSGDLILTIQAHRDRTTDIDFTSDSSIFATVSEDGSAKLWNFNSKKLIGPLADTWGWISSVAFSPDNAIVAIGSSNNYVQLYDVNSREEIARMTGHDGEIFSLRFSQDGSYLISSSFDMTIRIWDIKKQTLEMTLTGHRAGVFKAIPFDNGQKIVSCSNDSSVKLWKLMRKQVPEFRFTAKGLMQCVCYSPQGKHVIGGGYDGCLYVLDRQSGSVRYVKAHQKRIHQLLVSPDASLIITASDDNTLKVWDFEKLELLKQLSWDDKRVQSTDYAPDGSNIAICLSNGDVALWNLITKSPNIIGNLESNYGHVKFMNHNRLLIGVSSSENSFRLWDTETGNQIKIASLFKSIPYCIDVSPDDSLLAVSLDNQTIHLFDITSLKLIKTVYDHDGEIAYITFSPNGDLLATASWDKHLRLFKTDTWEKVLTITNDNRPLRSTIDFSPDGEEFIWGTYFGSARRFHFKEEFLTRDPALYLKESQQAAGYTLVRSKLVSTEQLADSKE